MSSRAEVWEQQDWGHGLLGGSLPLQAAVAAEQVPMSALMEAELTASLMDAYGAPDAAVVQ